MNPEQRYERHKTSVEKYLRSFITDHKPQTLYSPAKYVLVAGGKRIRPVLTLLACEAVGGDASTALHAGAGIEILHNFTLVHDDIMDHADTRRGRLTVHKKWDENVAILSGDALLAFAYRALLRTKSTRIQEVSKIFTEGVVTICEGQSLDKEFETRHRVHVNEYLMMIEKKTGKLVSIAAQIGALIGNASASDLEALRRYGEYVGRAFQIQDDLLDITADEKEFGKTIGGDLVEGKKTFLLLEALRRAKGDQKKMLQRIFTNGGVPRKQVPAFRLIYEETGAIESAQKRIENDIMDAKNQLSMLPASPARETLRWMTDKLLNRKF
ncbi:MAG: polyprenyl synthetase family protein [Ignavibacteriae bacterium]|nr:MAG: polyprenyl synthetase family protein [Ignavibacteriota bacterium]